MRLASSHAAQLYRLQGRQPSVNSERVAAAVANAERRTSEQLLGAPPSIGSTALHTGRAHPTYAQSSPVAVGEASSSITPRVADNVLPAVDGSPIEPGLGISNVVFTLIRSEEDLDMLRERSRCLTRALPGGHLFDEVMFHDGSLLVEAAVTIRANSPHVRLVDARKYGAFISPKVSVEDTSSLGYKHMVRLSGTRICHTGCFQTY
jgi:hypothetical protein|eukprot:7360642-Prymnesium_polylepis.5